MDIIKSYAVRVFFQEHCAVRKSGQALRLVLRKISGLSWLWVGIQPAMFTENAQNNAGGTMYTVILATVVAVGTTLCCMTRPAEKHDAFLVACLTTGSVFNAAVPCEGPATK